MTTAEALSQFGGTTDVRRQRGAVVALVKSKRIHEVAGDSSFQEGLARLAHAVRSESDPQARLTAIATLERAAAVSRTLRPVVDELLKTAVTDPLAGLHELNDPDDRLYAARSWRAVRSDRCYLEALATAAVREELAESVRKECIEGVVELSPDIASGLATLRHALLSVQFPTKKPGDSLGRRLKRILAVYATAISGSDKAPGPAVGRALGRLIEGGFRATGRPESARVATDLAERVAGLIHQIVRSGFSVAADGKTYEALAVVLEWMDKDEWSSLCDASEVVTRVRGDVREALVLLARLGVTDQYLRQALVTTSGSTGRADAICRDIAKTTPGIAPDVRDWLAGVTARRRSASAEESQTRSIDEILAEVLVDMNRLSHASSLVRTDVLPEISAALPQLVRMLSRLTGLADSFVSKLQLAVAWRSLRIRGKVGQEVDFSPVEHELASGSRGARRVRLLSPIVERLTEDGLPRVVLKAVVEPVQPPARDPGPRT